MHRLGVEMKQCLVGSKMSQHALMPLIKRFLEFKSGLESHCLFQMKKETTAVFKEHIQAR